MALDIYTNNYSLVAQNNLNTANSALSKSIERLSSGLRINHAADDASGLAISEKLRGQIRGLAKASMNAQDAVSFLQTAEGGMEVIGDMLQRMRELSVQAGNGTYTSNDRKELQKEVDQLKSEIDRVSASTEFNTKKVLTGDSAAIWSTSDPASIQAIVKGAPAEGNYRLEVEATGGTNFVYKTDIMNLGAPEKSISVHEQSFTYASGAKTSGANFQTLEGDLKSSHTIVAKIDDAAATVVTSGSATISVHKNPVQGGTVSNIDLMTFTKTAALTSGYAVIEVLKDGDMSVGGFTQEDFKIYTIDGKTGAKTERTTSNAAITAGGSFDIANVGTFDFANVSKIAKGDKLLIGVTQGDAGAANAPVIDIDGGKVQISGAAGISLNNFAVAEMDGSGNISYGRGTVNVPVGTGATGTSTMTMSGTLVNKGLLEVDSGNTVDTKVDTLKSRVVGGNYPNGLDVKVGKGSAIIASATLSGSHLQDNTLTTTVATGTPTATGHYVIEVLNQKSDLASYQVADFRATFIDANTGLETSSTVAYAAGTLTVGGSTIALAGGNLTKNDKLLLSTTLASAATAGNASVKVGGVEVDVAAAKLNEFSIYNAQLDSTGNLVKSRVELSLGDNTGGSIRFASPKAKVADLETKLKDISLFTNADGRNILDNTQEITVFGNGKTATVTMEGKDSVKDFTKKLNDALLNLGMGSGNQDVDNNLVRYVTEKDAKESGNLAVAGTFIFQSGLVGDNSKISIIGDQNVLNALSVAELQKGENSDLKVTVTDAHNGKLIGEDTVSDNVLRGVIKGIDVKINNPGIGAGYNKDTGEISFSSAGKANSFDLHIVDNRTSVQIGANEGQTFDVSIGQMNTTSLGIGDAYVLTMEDSQKAITKFDQALEKVNSARATIGAQINRLEYTTKNLSISRQNLVAAESRIRNLDVAEESASFANNQILVNAAVAMLAQANQLPQVAMQLIGR